MIITLTASALAVAFTPADEPALSAGFGIDDAESLVVYFDHSGNVEDVEGAELVRDDRALSHVCQIIGDFCSDAEVLPSSTSKGRVAVSFNDMIEYLERRYDLAG